ncbi:MAG: hypothetical protein Q8922_02760 [Bacteroidota bacterium]|nr:hypothetical protein [Bacteroidota bacterium]MDP4232887.1 hypothetical protein [Bacteroidota bacterium]MDP4241931.1 hypothetical protein [Bacteroidota bacterium]MDP4286834.1 hypothetical protein [Bacteroidota bacterium]
MKTLHLTRVHTVLCSKQFRFLSTAILVLVLLPPAANAQLKNQVSTNGTGVKREPAVAVRVWKDLTTHDDGETIAAAYILEGTGGASTGTVTSSVSTNGGMTWSGDQAALPNSYPAADEIEDQKIAYRLDGSNKPELVAAYRTYTGTTVDNVLVAFSSNNGNSWESTTLSLQSDGSQKTSRPIIATDNNNNGSTLRNTAYVVWRDSDRTTNQTFVYVKTVSTSHAAGTEVQIAESPYPCTSACYNVEACDIGIDAESNVYVLWRKVYIGSTLRDLIISKSTDGGSTWGAHAVGTGTSIEPSITLNYHDYPALTISQHGCSGTESAFVAYTEQGSGTTPPPSVLKLTSASLALTSWSTPLNVETDPSKPATAYPSDGNTYAWDFQYEPELAPDGIGGVFLLYYSAQHSGATHLPCAVIYESGPTGPRNALTAYPGISIAYKTTVFDYVGIVWNPILLVAHAVWTEYNTSATDMEIYATRVSNTGPSTNALIGDLGFSNQRKIVMTGNTPHMVGTGELTHSPTVNKDHAIWYSEQNEITKDWTGPIQLDYHDFDTFTNTTFPFSRKASNGTAPCIAVYQRSSDPNDQRAVAVVWAAQPPTATGYLNNQAILYIRVKESPCASGDIGDWSPVDSIAVTTLAEYGSFAPVVAPLTAAVTGTSNRYLIGWVVTFAHAELLQSVTYLRGPQSASGWVANENWGPHVGTWTAEVSKLVDDACPGVLPRYPPRLEAAGGSLNGSFISVTSNESNGYGLRDGAKSDLHPTSAPTMASQDVVFTGDGLMPNVGVWNLTAWYNTVASSTLGELAGLGQASNIQVPANPCNPPLISVGAPVPPKIVTISGIHLGTAYPVQNAFDRDPSITITSTGQRIAAWEHLEGPFGLVPVVSLQAAVGGGRLVECPSALLNTYTSIRIRQTQNNGTWPTMQDVISGSAQNVFTGPGNAPLWTWLRNPSVTAFPKTPDAPHNSSVYDPGAAELLFWQQNMIKTNGCLVTQTTPNALHERRFWQQTQGAWWLGQWYANDNPDPAGWGSPYPSGYSGANSQRSFGIYNNGPQWPTAPPPYGSQLLGNTLKDRDGNPYARGLSYGIGNAVTSGLPQPTLCNPIPDVGAFKLGTFDTALGVEFYRSETRVKDSSMVTFKWGKVWVEDTVFGIPIREVMLHNGIPDSTFASHDAIRDSIFATEWFNWPVSAEIKYDRLMLFPQAGTLYFNIDTSVAYDTLGDSVLVFDTVPSTFTTDTIQRTDSCFISPVVSMKYTVELVHQNGHIDTVEQLRYDPYDSVYIWPRTVHIAHSSDAADTVMLRVRGQLTGIPDYDSLVGFERETMLDTYPSWGDTTIAIATGGGILPPPDTCFAVDGPYANPSYPSENDVSILVHYCASGSTISAQVYDYLGYSVGSASTFTSDAQVWDRLPINSPLVSGTYYIVVTVGSYSGTLGYVVY